MKIEYTYKLFVMTTVLFLWWSAFDGLLDADTFLVTNTLDSGLGSLRQALTDANSHAGADTIELNIPQDDPGFNGYVWTIHPSRECEIIDDSTYIDGFSQEHFTGDTNPQGPEVEIFSVETVFRITSSHNTLRGLVINGFETTGVRIEEGDGNTLSDNYIGTDYCGNAASCNGIGVHLSEEASDNMMFANVIAGTEPVGVYIEGDNTRNNSVRENKIGTNKDGSDIIEGGNIGHGIFILSNLVTFGGPEGNTILGNTIAGFQWGIYCAGAGTEYNSIEDNYVGISESGVILGNRDAGIHLCDGPKHNTVKGNIVAGVTGGQAFQSGININGSETWDNRIEGNTLISNYYGMSLSGWTGGIHSGDCMNENCVNSVFGNTIRKGVSHGIYVASLNARNTITENSIVENGGNGVHIAGTNNGIVLSKNSITRNLGVGIVSSSPAPQLETYENYSVHGIAVPHATVELFSDSLDEGEHFLGETLADSAGNFIFDLKDTHAFGVFTATATVEGAGTSGFSSPLAVPLSITSSILPEGWKGVAYSETLSAIGGVPPYVWSHLSGPLTSGVQLDSEGVISGTPDEVGTSAFSVEVSDGAESTDVQALTLTIHSCLKGDVDHDGDVDVTDVLRVVNIMLRLGNPPTEFEECAADCNDDGKIDILDIVGMVNMILGAGEYKR